MLQHIFDQWFHIYIRAELEPMRHNHRGFPHAKCSGSNPLLGRVLRVEILIDFSHFRFPVALAPAQKPKYSKTMVIYFILSRSMVRQYLPLNLTAKVNTWLQEECLRRLLSLTYKLPNNHKITSSLQGTIWRQQWIYTGKTKRHLLHVVIIPLYTFVG